jgi:hypothetical protein
MPEPLLMDRIVFNRISNYNPEYYLVCQFQDREGVDDFYRINFYRNGYYLEDDMILYQGEFTDGEEIIIDNLHTYFRQFDRVNIEIFSLNRNIYEYYSFLENALTTSEDDATDIIEFGYANPKSNISNGALGFFSAQSYTTQMRIVR